MSSRAKRAGTSARGGVLLDQPAPDGVHHGFEPVACSKFMIGVMDMIAEGAGSDAQILGHVVRTLALGEERQYPLLLLGEGRSRRGVGAAIRQAC